jgi:hypothetical protein
LHIATPVVDSVQLPQLVGQATQVLLEAIMIWLAWQVLQTSPGVFMVQVAQPMGHAPHGPELRTNRELHTEQTMTPLPPSEHV